MLIIYKEITNSQYFTINFPKNFNLTISAPKIIKLFTLDKQDLRFNFSYAWYEWKVIINIF